MSDLEDRNSATESSGSQDEDNEDQDEQEGELEEEELSEINFEEYPEFVNLPPLDPLRKCRREVLRTINTSRAAEELNFLDPNMLAQKVANLYAAIVIEDETEDEERLKQLWESEKCLGEYKHLVSQIYLDEDLEEAKYLVDPFIDTHLLALEIPEDRKICMGQYTHSGLGLSVGDQKCVLVELYSQYKLTIGQISEGDNGVEIRGKMLKSDVGIYACRVLNRQHNKEIILVGPQNMSMEFNTWDFLIILPLEDGIQYEEDEAVFLVEIYIRNKPESIPYGKSTGEKINVKHVELAFRCPLEYFPDPRHVIEDANDSRKDEEAMKRKQEEENAKKQVDQLEQEKKQQQWQEQKKLLADQEKERQVQEEDQKSEKESISSLQKTKTSSQVVTSIATKKSQKQLGEPSDQKDQTVKSASSKSESEMSQEEASQLEQEVSQKEVREELLVAIADAKQQKYQLDQQNAQLQRKVIAVRMRSEIQQQDRQEATMNEHKYYNTLTHVHHVRMKLKDTQEQYNRMANELEDKLVEKKEKCKEIRDSFVEFKREVAKNAEFNRTGKPIPRKMIEEWEQKEAAKDKEVAECRLANIRLRNKLAKLEKQLKKKEELAEGLHLIDFEQLKIENQTLNEKIEERNEELLKLRKKTINTVQILTHTREKLHFVTKENELKQQELKKIQDALNELQSQLTKLKQQRDIDRIRLMKLNQETMISNSEELEKDYKQNKAQLRKLEGEIQKEKEKHKKLTETVERAAMLAQDQQNA